MRFNTKICIYIFCSLGFLLGLYSSLDNLSTVLYPCKITTVHNKYCYEVKAKLYMIQNVTINNYNLVNLECGEVRNCRISPCYNHKIETGANIYCRRDRNGNFYYDFWLPLKIFLSSLLLLFCGSISAVLCIGCNESRQRR